MMKPFYVHVGLPRCASTLIENIFLFPEHEGYQSLRNDNILPLPRLYKEFRRNVDVPVWSDELCTRLRDYHVAPLLHHDASGFFTSDEGLTGINDRPGVPLVYANRVMVLRRLCEGFDLRLLLLVRNQARYVVSMYGLHLQNGGQTGFNDYVAAFPYAHLDWLRVANTLAEFVGTDAVTVMPFEKELYPASGSSNGNFLEAFQNAMAISRPVKLETLPLVNPSLVPKYHATKLRANQGDDAEGAAATIPEGDAAYYSASKESPLSPEQAKAIMARYADTNRELFARYMPDFDATAYQPGGLT